MVKHDQRPKLGPTQVGRLPREIADMQNLSNERTEYYCGEHRRRLELFCQEDETFICVQCVPTHASHTFIFLHEADSISKDKLTAFLSFLESKVNAFQDFQKRLKKELINIHEDARSLEQHITTEFAKLHQFLLDHEYKHIQQLKSIEGEILEEIKVNIEYIKNYMIIQEAICDVNTKIKQKDAEILIETEEQSGGIKNDAQIRHEALSDVHLKLDSIAEVLKEVGENPDCSEYSVIDTQVTVFDGDLWNKNEEAKMSEIMNDPFECIKNDITLTCKAEFDVDLEVKSKEIEVLKTTRENLECSKLNLVATLNEVPDKFVLMSKGGDIPIEADENSAKNVSMEIKSENAETVFLKEIEEATKCLKHDFIPAQRAVPYVNLQDREQDETTECLKQDFIPAQRAVPYVNLQDREQDETTECLKQDFIPAQRAVPYVNLQDREQDETTECLKQDFIPAQRAVPYVNLKDREEDETTECLKQDFIPAQRTEPYVNLQDREQNETTECLKQDFIPAQRAVPYVNLQDREQNETTECLKQDFIPAQRAVPYVNLEDREQDRSGLLTVSLLCFCFTMA
ncbi:uncharacterized protein LOC122814316 [Protopterus annectens]|uniref:uncharacterized protein LOC122814316 n=1 Tax=Protopterus annectens TaxID=7888 RepID=UPI001CFA8B16|nr:uncharacterized protein LOC122814316 [Protopterus annectens]